MTGNEVLKKYFGYDSFRKGQEEIITEILAGKDALAIMPTGAGKSVCYQVPALLLSGITLVISPLISLMQDQVKSLNEAGIHAAFINSSLTEQQISKALCLASQGRYKIIYVAPERLESDNFIHFALNTEISMVTVDEAHCISQWGQDFRPSYLKIVKFIEGLPKRPVISAFTATATDEVKTDIECILRLNNPKVVITGFDRENLYYSVEHITGKRKDDFVLDYIHKHQSESGIIYCATRKNVDSLYEKLMANGLSVTRYHAGIGNEERKKNQEDFIYDRVQIVIATNAFGMGIDKSNVRYVIHYNMPQSMENYYQEAGRAGRDGENSQCILLFSPQDIMINKFLLENKEFDGVDDSDREIVQQRDFRRLQVMEGYCKTTTCLRNYILEYFGEKTVKPCDNCGNCERSYLEFDMTKEAKWVINCIAESKGRFGQNIILGTLLGANRARLKEIGAMDYRSYGILKDSNESDMRILIDNMLMEGYIIQTDDRYSVLKIGDISRLKNEDAHVFIRKSEEKSEFSKRGKNKRSTDLLTREGYELFEKLRNLRLVIAKEEAMPPYIIFNDKTLIDMCVKTPENKQEMLSVSGVGENKYEKYGQRFLDEIEEYMEDNPDAVTSIREDEESTDYVFGNGDNRQIADRTRLGRKARDRKIKSPFYLNEEDAKKFPYAEYDYVGDIKQKLNDICTVEGVKKITASVILNFLMEENIIDEVENAMGITGFGKTYTEKGLQMGVKVEKRVSQKGTEYQVLLYPETVQKMVVEYFTGEREKEQYAVWEGMDKGNAGGIWSGEEDSRLISEYHSGMKVAEIAKEHGRTKGAIVARLRKQGLME